MGDGEEEKDGRLRGREIPGFESGYLAGDRQAKMTEEVAVQNLKGL